ncbi:MAG TPA: class I SAM-dependent methyltransferase [Candidatus Udaeobacter sp.]|nr:class I SAM-dependent methyltransferase [Candidatus Udaeobacter sp.]
MGGYPGMIRLAEKHPQETKLKVEFLDLPGERIPLENGSIDTVVSAFTLCTIPGVLEAIRGIGRVLKPGGRLIFFEHGLVPDARIRRWQQWSDPIPRRVFEGCYSHPSPPGEQSVCECSVNAFRSERSSGGCNRTGFFVFEARRFPASCP